MSLPLQYAVIASVLSICVSFVIHRILKNLTGPSECDHCEGCHHGSAEPECEGCHHGSAEPECEDCHQ